MTTVQALLIEDNAADAKLIEVVMRSTFGTEGTLHHCPSLEAGQEAMNSGAYTILLSDLNLPDSEAESTLGFIAEASELLPVVVITGIESDDLVSQALENGAQDYLVKGNITKDVFRRTIRHATERQKLINRLRTLNQELTEAMGKIRTLEGLLPICSYCKKIRDESPEEQETEGDNWVQLETYLRHHSGAELSHGICPDCMAKAKLELEEAKAQMRKQKGQGQ